MAATADKRSDRRVKVDLWIEVQREGELYFQRAANLSVGGAFFHQTVPLPVGTVVDLRFGLPDDAQIIACRGVIVATQELGMGVRFQELGPLDRARLERFVNAHA